MTHAKIAAAIEDLKAAHLFHSAAQLQQKLTEATRLDPYIGSLEEELDNEAFSGAEDL